MKEVTYEDWQKNPTPRMMWVWDDYESSKGKMKVIYVNDNINAEYPVIAMTEDEIDVTEFKHCVEIEGPKTRRMTNQELSWWIREKPTREFKFKGTNLVSFEYCYIDKDACVPADDVLIRENGGEWYEPLVEVEE